MANYISKINIAGVVYDIYDKEARDLLAKTLVFVGVTTTAVSDGATTPATYDGLSGITIPPGHVAGDPLDAGTVVIYNQKEFVWDGSKWAEFGDLSDLSLSTTTGNFVTGVTATPTNTATNTGAGSAHSHTIGGTTKYMGVSNNGFLSPVTSSQSTPSVQSSVALGTVQDTSSGAGAGVITGLTTTQKLVTAQSTLAKTGTAVGVFNSITSTQGTDGIKVITDVSGGGQAGEVITEGVAAVLAPTVATGLLTSNATATGRIAYTAGVTATNKMVTANVTPAAVGTAFSYVNGYSTALSLGEDQIPFVADAIPLISGHTLNKATQTASINSDGTNTYTLTLASEVALGTLGDGGWGMTQAVFPTFTKNYLTFASATPAVAGTQITYATGALATNGSGSAVATGGTTSYLYLSTTTQTTNTPTVVSFGTVVINGTPSYIHTSNIVPAVGQTITYATGALSNTGSGSAVVTGGTTKYLTLGAQTPGNVVPTVATGEYNISTTGKIPVGYTIIASNASDATYKQAFIAQIDSTTGTESAHTHSYSKATAISVSAPTASAITSVSLTPAS